MLTPVEVTRDGIYLKRDDLYCWSGAKGGKARSVEAIIGNGKPRGLVTCGPLNSSQIGVVGRIAHDMGWPCRAHVPDGVLGEGPMAAAVRGAKIVRHLGASFDEIDAAAREDALESGFRLIPLGCSVWPTVCATAAATSNLPRVKRIVMPVGTGTQLCGVLWGAIAAQRADNVLGVVHCNGLDLPQRTLACYAPRGTEKVLELVAAAKPPVAKIAGIKLNPDYEAYAAAYAEPGDLLWLVGGPVEC